MKIAITSTGKNLDSAIDSRFGRAKTFIVFDTETDEFESVDNTQNLNAAQGAGIQAAQNLINTGAEVLITGHCGPKAFQTLDAGDVKVFYASKGSVKEVIAQYKNNELTEADNADVEAHW